MSNALLVVDVQRYFMKDAPQDLPQRVVNHIDATSYDHVVFARFKNEPDSNFVKLLKWTKCATDNDAELPEEFANLAHKDNVFTRATYSAFKTTGLDEYLREREVERLVVCGVDTDACVLATAFEAFDLGYHVKIDFNLTYSSNDLRKAAMLIAEKNITSRD
jgi:nicotinamidase-related amidase